MHANRLVIDDECLRHPEQRFWIWDGSGGRRPNLCRAAFGDANPWWGTANVTEGFAIMIPKTVIVGTVAAAALLLSSFTHAAVTDYAEGIYRDYSAASSDGVQFKVETLASGSTSDLVGLPMSAFTGVPVYSIYVEEQGLSLREVQFVKSDLGEMYLDDLDFRVEEFDKAGFPVDRGQYRQLEITVGIGKDSRTHRAIEFCWSAQDHCVVFDPNVDFIDSVVNNMRAAKASGWAPQIVGEPALLTLNPGQETTAGRCGLASHPSWIAAQITWPARTVTYKSLVGLKVVTKNIGTIQAGLRCNSSCNPAPYGYSNASSASAIYPNSVQCDHAAKHGTSGKSGKFAGKGGCAHRFVLGAKMNATAKGVGVGVDVQLDWTGGLDYNGGHYYDTCGRF